MPLDAAFKILLNIHLYSLWLPSSPVSFIPPLFFFPFPGRGKDLFKLHCSRLTSSCRYIQIKSLVTFTATTRMRFLADMCRGMQGGAISLLPESIRRQPRAHISGLLPSMHQPGIAVCSPPKAALSQRSFLLTKTTVDHFL